MKLNKIICIFIVSLIFNVSNASIHKWTCLQCEVILMRTAERLSRQNDQITFENFKLTFEVVF